jgi:cytochrome c5
MENPMKIRLAASLVLALSMCALAVYGLSVPGTSQAQVEKDQHAPETAPPAAAIYKKNCASCHDHAIMGAPKPGDPRFSTDIDILVENAIKGIGKMPARGHASFLTDDEIRSVVEYMREPADK